MDRTLAELLRDPELADISADPEVMDGLPVLRGTRIPVYIVLEMLEAGRDEAAIQAQYPTLPAGAVRTALRFAGRLAAAV